MPLSKGPTKVDVATVTGRIKDPGIAIDAPWFVAHYLVRAALLQFKRQTGRTPRLMYLPKAVEAAVQIDLARSEDKHLKLRTGGSAQELFGCPVIWDADEFRIE